MEQSVRDRRDRSSSEKLSPVGRVRQRESESVLTKNDITQVFGSNANDIDQIEEVHHKNGHWCLALVALTDEESKDRVTAARETLISRGRGSKPCTLKSNHHTAALQARRPEREDREVGIQRAQVRKIERRERRATQTHGRSDDDAVRK